MAYKAKVLALADGGTNANLTASNGGILYSTASAAAILSGTATANQLLVSGSSTNPAWTTSTYPTTNAVSTLLYASSANVMAALPTANKGMLVTSSTGVPSITAVSSFSAYKSSNSTNATGAGTVFTVIAGTVSYDALSDYNSSTGVFTCRNAGIHQFIFNCFILNCTVASALTLTVTAGGSAFSNHFNRTAGSASFGLQMTCQAAMTAGQTAAFTLSVTGEAGDTNTVYGSAYDGTWFQGRWLGPN